MNASSDTPLREAEFPDATTLGAPASIAQSPWIVMKFGGTSVTGCENWSIIAQLIRNRLNANLKPFIVHSALAGVSDLLDCIARKNKLAHSVQRVVAIHQDQAKQLNLDAASVLEAEFAELHQLADVINDTATPAAATVAQLLSLGEIMSTRLGSAYLQEQGVKNTWVDARKWLRSREQKNKSERQHILSAVCNYSPDEALTEFASAHECIVTQGFIARDEKERTVVLGRGGSDSSAAYFSAKLQAQRLEIWTDVPGMFSSDPRIVPSARLLKALYFDEAQEIAAMGGSVLHPHSLSPPATYGIPVFVRCTAQPHLTGTCIAKVTPDSEAQVKAIASRSGLKLLSLESVAMWQEVGFLADAFAVFSRHGVSIDLISTSESNVTVSIDAASNAIENDAFESMLEQLRTLCTVTLIEECASVSLVGRNIRNLLHKLGPALAVFAEHKIHLVSQSASDLNLTFVVDKNQGERLCNKLHSTIISMDTTHSTFGPTWTDLQTGAPPTTGQHKPLAKRWWEDQAAHLCDLLKPHDCAYVYHGDTIRARAATLQSIGALDSTLYAMKANPNKQVLGIINDTGLSFECVSPGELQRLFELFPDIDRSRILYTPNFATRADYQFGIKAGVTVTLDNLYPLRHWPEEFRNQQVFIRIDPGQGRGHHELVRTAGSHSKFGVPLFELDELHKLISLCGARVIGIHAHSGSGIMDPNNWNDVGHVLSAAAERFGTVQVLDLGGGLGVPEKPGDPPIDLRALEVSLLALKKAHPEYKLWMEPGRYLVAECGVLLARVTQTKGKGNVQYVGVATGMNSLIRPALYGAYHEIVNLTRLNEPATERYTVVGPNCETGDRLGLDRMLPKCIEGDILLIANTGAYGYAMSSNYNLRAPAVEILL